MLFRISVLTSLAVALVCAAAVAQGAQAGNLGYNSYEGALSKGQGLQHWGGPGVGYSAESGSYMRRYMPSSKWGRYGYGTGHLGKGYGPYVFSNRTGASPPGLFDPLPEAYTSLPPPSISVRNGEVRVGLRNDIPGIRRVTVTVLAFNGAELNSQIIDSPPFNFGLPVMDGAKNVRVRIDYANNGLSATSYPL